MATHPTSSPPATALTAEELLRLSADDRRRELVAGELREMAPAGAEHGAVAARILALLDRSAAETGAGRVFAAETGFLLSRAPDTVRAPDAAFVTQDRAEATGRVRGYWPGPPDLAVEVVPPGDSYSELHEKALAWLYAGARVVLVADPVSRHITVYRSSADVRVRRCRRGPRGSPSRVLQFVLSRSRIKCDRDYRVDPSRRLLVAGARWPSRHFGASIATSLRLGERCSMLGLPDRQAVQRGVISGTAACGGQAAGS